MQQNQWSCSGCGKAPDWFRSARQNTRYPSRPTQQLSGQRPRGFRAEEDMTSFAYDVALAPEPAESGTAGDRPAGREAWALLEASGALAMRVDVQGRILQATEATADLLEIPSRHLLRTSVLDVIAPESRDSVAALLQACARTAPPAASACALPAARRRLAGPAHRAPARRGQHPGEPAAVLAMTSRTGSRTSASSTPAPSWTR